MDAEKETRTQREGGARDMGGGRHRLGTERQTAGQETDRGGGGGRGQRHRGRGKRERQRAGRERERAGTETERDFCSSGFQFSQHRERTQEFRDGDPVRQHRLTHPGKGDHVGTRWQRSLRIRMMITHACSPLALAF